MGFAAAVLAQFKRTGLAVSVSNVTKEAKDWRCGGVPILALLEAMPKEGFSRSDLVVKSDNVSTDGHTFQQMKS